MHPNIDHICSRIRNLIVEELVIRDVPSIERIVDSDRPQITRTLGNPSQPSHQAPMAALPTDNLDALSATIRDLQNQFAIMQTKHSTEVSEMKAKYELQTSEVTALRLKLTETQNPSPTLKTDADPERFAKVFKVYIEHTPGVSPFAALCTAVQDHPEACAWTLQYGEEHKEPEKRTLEKLMMAFTERFAPQTTSGGSWREVANRRPAPPPPPPSSQTGAGPSNAAPPQNQAPGVRFSALPKSTQATPRRFQSAVRPPRNHAQSNQPQKRKRQDLHLSNPNGATTYFANYLGRCLTHKEYHQHRRKGLCGRCGENGHIGEDCAKYQYVRTEHQDVMTE
ncbi:hypothetical protein Vafri_19096 [Volvox africanus]|uniref:CCHC-type domain-containing protein n=1 Tax=Volvox africanus TaxID=51714 RepID=A0A8J4BQL3_9CHLO|nr:hypothetical protein Vafri_19096 [Volvox africanus]